MSLALSSPASSSAPGDAMTFISVLRLVAAWFAPRQVPLVTQLTGMVGQGGQILSAIPLVALLHGPGWTPAFLSAAGAQHPRRGARPRRSSGTHRTGRSTDEHAPTVAQVQADLVVGLEASRAPGSGC